MMVRSIRRFAQSLRAGGAGAALQLACAKIRVERARVTQRRRSGWFAEVLRALPDDIGVDAACEVAWNSPAGLILPMQDKGEFKAFLQAVFGERSVKSVLEIGTANGGTLFCFCRLAEPDAVIVSIDLPSGDYGGGWPLWKRPVIDRFARARQRLHMLREDSHAPTTVRAVRNLLNGMPLDLLFIDGDHSYAGVKSDFEAYAPFVRPGGVVAFHDILTEGMGVSRFWQEIKGVGSQEFAMSGKIGIGMLAIRTPISSE